MRLRDPDNSLQPPSLLAEAGEAVPRLRQHARKVVNAWRMALLKKCRSDRRRHPGAGDCQNGEGVGQCARPWFRAESDYLEHVVGEGRQEPFRPHSAESSPLDSAESDSIQVSEDSFDHGLPSAHGTFEPGSLHRPERVSKLAVALCELHEAPL